MPGLSVGKNMMWNSAGSIIYLVCQWLLTVLVVRLSGGYDAAGLLALAMAVSNIFAPIALYRIRSYQVSDVEHRISASEFVAFRLVTIGVGFAITFAYSLFTCSPSALVPVLLYVLFRAGEVFIDVLHGVDQLYDRMDYCGISLAVRGILFLLAFSVVLFCTNSLSLAILSMIVVTYPVIIYDVRKARQFQDVKPKITTEQAKRLALDCLPAVLGLVFCFSVTTVSRQYLGFVSGEAALGIYASVCTPALIIQAGANYVYAPLLGSFAKCFCARDSQAFFRLFAKVTAFIIIIFALGSLGFLLLGEWFLSLAFGQDIVSYSYLLFPALIAVGSTAYVAFISDLLITVRGMRGNFVGNAVSFGVSIPATILFVAWWGMNGVSFAIALSYAIGTGIMMWYLIKRIKEGLHG